LGTFNPILKNTKNPSEKINFKTERLIVWLNKGAQPTETVLNFLKQKGIWKAYLDSKKKPAKKKAKRKLSAKRKLVKKEKKHRPKKAKKPVPNQLPPSESSNQ
jgi:small subunit ribosomal protein S16